MHDRWLPHALRNTQEDWKIDNLLNSEGRAWQEHHLVLAVLGGLEAEADAATEDQDASEAKTKAAILFRKTLDKFLSGSIDWEELSETAKRLAGSGYILGTGTDGPFYQGKVLQEEKLFAHIVDGRTGRVVRWSTSENLNLFFFRFMLFLPFNTNVQLFFSKKK